MDLLTWILVGILAYWLGLVVVRRRGWLPDSISVTGPVTTIRTQRGRALLDRLARRRRVWRALASLGVGVAIVVMIGAFFMLLASAVLTVLSPSPQQIQQPQNVLVIPGVNEFLPLEVAPEIVIGLVLGLVIHEGGHGLLCRVEGIEIKSMGVALLAFIPLGAFVEPDEASADAASRGSQVRMFAAGVTGNFIVTLVVFALLFGPVAGAISIAPGAAVGGALPDSGASEAGIGAGDRITEINAHAIDDFDHLVDHLDAVADRYVTVEVNGDRAVEVERSLLVTASAPDGPAGIDRGATILEVDGTPVYTMSAMRDALDGRDEATLRYRPDGGDAHTRTVPIGAYAIVADGPMAAAGLETGSDVVITEIDGEQVISSSDLQAILDARSPETTVPIAYWADGERHTVEVTLDDAGDGGGFLGISTARGISGLHLSDFGIQEYPASAYLALLGGGDADDDPFGVAESFFGKVVIAIFLPLASLVLGGVLPFNFPGFTADTANFFVVEGALGGLGGGLFLLANLLFWTGWVNLNLAIFNCIPAVPLDGGHILRSSLESVLAYLPVTVSHRTVSAIVTAIALVMLASFGLLIFGAGLFG